jgi:CRP/FNR family transcriptional regulator
MQDTKQQWEERLFFLRTCEIFQHFTADELRLVAERAPDRVVKTGEYVFANREEAAAFYLLKKGRVKLVRVSAEGSERIEDILFPCDVFGLFFDEPGVGPREVDLRAEALTDSLVATLERSTLEELIQKSPRAALAITRTLVDRLREAQRRLDRLYFDSSRSRLAKHLVDLAEQHGKPQGDRVVLELPLNQEELGELIGASRVTVNQLLGEFRREAFLESGKGTYTLKLDQLRELV